MRGKSLLIMAAAIIMSLCISMATGESRSSALNPYLPLWEHIPDGEPYIFEDPANPGQYRLYVYGSHDTFQDRFCGDDLVVWSASLDNLADWRYDGVIFENNGDTLYAPDIAVVDNGDGSKTYYLYPNDQNNMGIIAKSDSPTGPFEVCHTKGVLGFDPAVFVDDDGRVYGYWGFQNSFMAELDPETMCTVKSGCKVLDESDTGIDGSEDTKNLYRFFEASSIRKINDNGFTRYVLVYSRKTVDGEFGIGPSNSTLAYAYSENPLGPWTYGGTVVDSRARQTDENGKTIVTMQYSNTHGSIIELNGEWFVFYHRSTNNTMYARQGTADKIDVSINDNGEVVITEAEVTSEGLETNGLNPYKTYSAGILCYNTGGAFVKATYDKEYDGNPVCNTKVGSILGYKYFNFNKEDWQDTDFEIEYIGKGNDGWISLMLDSPWESKGGTFIGEIPIKAQADTGKINKERVSLYGMDEISGKHAVYMVFDSDTSTELADVYNFRFILTGENPYTPAPAVTEAPKATPAPSGAKYPTASTQPDIDDKKIEIGKLYIKGKYAYKLISVNSDGKGVVSFAGVTSKKIKKVIIPKTVKINGITCSVQRIEKKAMAGCTKLKSIIIKTKKLKSVGNACLKKVYKKAVIKVPGAKIKLYTRLFKGKGPDTISFLKI